MARTLFVRDGRSQYDANSPAFRDRGLLKPLSRAVSLRVAPILGRLTWVISALMILPLWEDEPLMRLLGRNRLDPLYARGVAIRTWTLSWVSEVLNATWSCPADVIVQFPNLSQENGNLFIFPVISSTSSIALLIAFPQQIAVVAALRT
jgi:hypothetical protein